MRDNLIAFRLTDKEMKKLIRLTQKTSEFTAKSYNEAARFIVTKKLGEWYRPGSEEKSLRA